jgi:hypothetical protein
MARGRLQDRVDHLLTENDVYHSEREGLPSSEFNTESSLSLIEREIGV